MTINRILRFIRPRRARAPVTNYWYVITEQATIRVDPRQARVISAELERWRRREWLEIRDSDGSRVMIRPRDLRMLAESTREQRDAWRAWNKARRVEDNEANDSPWASA